MKILITGSNGYLGSQLAVYLAKAGHQVVATARSPEKISSVVQNQCQIEKLALNEDFNLDILHGVEAIFHCAHDFIPRGYNTNIEGTKKIYNHAVKMGTRKQIFLSSYSARKDAISNYGKIKYELENFFIEAKEIVVRPGLVIGHGGLFGQNMHKLLKFPLIPLINGGRDLVPVLSIKDFLQAMEKILMASQPDTYNLFNQELIPMNNLVKILKHQAQQKVWIFPLPLSAAISVITFLNKIGIKLPIGIENLKGQQINQQPIHQSHLAQIISQETSIESMVKNALHDFSLEKLACKHQQRKSPESPRRQLGRETKDNFSWDP
jgi:nucleoside-diphosphate-sugar epimerase